MSQKRAKRERRAPEPTQTKTPAPTLGPVLTLEQIVTQHPGDLPSQVKCVEEHLQRLAAVRDSKRAEIRAWNDRANRDLVAIIEEGQRWDGALYMLQALVAGTAPNPPPSTKP